MIEFKIGRMKFITIDLVSSTFGLPAYFSADVLVTCIATEEATGVLLFSSCVTDHTHTENSCIGDCCLGIHILIKLVLKDEILKLKKFNSIVVYKNRILENFKL